MQLDRRKRLLAQADMPMIPQDVPEESLDYPIQERGDEIESLMNKGENYEPQMRFLKNVIQEREAARKRDNPYHGEEMDQDAIERMRDQIQKYMPKFGPLPEEWLKELNRHDNLA